MSKTREIVFEDKNLYKHLIQKGELIDEGRELTKQIDKLSKDRNRIGLKVQKLKDKIVPPVIQQMDVHIGEFEEVQNVVPSKEKNKVVVTVFDAVEEFKESYTRKRNEIKKELEDKKREEK